MIDTAAYGCDETNWAGAAIVRDFQTESGAYSRMRDAMEDLLDRPALG